MDIDTAKANVAADMRMRHDLLRNGSLNEWGAPTQAKRCYDPNYRTPEGGPLVFGNPPNILMAESRAAAWLQHNLL